MNDTGLFEGKKILITAGPTQEAIDPVRYISNHSSGKMGYALADNLLKEGATVLFVSGPVNLFLDHPRLTLVRVVSAYEMYQAASSFFKEIDIAIFAAAVADYRPLLANERKIKKDGNSLTIELVKNVDIAYEFGCQKQPNQISVGFALETHDEINQAYQKMDKKHFDLVVLNSMNDAGATFGFDTNKVNILDKRGEWSVFPLKSKDEVAKDIIGELRKIVVNG